MENRSACVKAACRMGSEGIIAQGMDDKERERRLAEALRENLRKRKAQARGEEPGAKPSEPEAGS
jgi:hypothetical protein